MNKFYSFSYYFQYVETYEFNPEQLKQIKKGLKEKPHFVKYYANPEVPANNMREVRLGYNQGVDILKHIDIFQNWRDLEATRILLINKKKYECALWNARQRKIMNLEEELK